MRNRNPKLKRELVYLTQEELAQIMTYSFASQELQQVADMFAFQCWTGFTFSDLCVFVPDNLVEQNGNIWISYDRMKSSRKITLPLFRQAKAILKKYQYQFPVFTNARFNSCLKEIAKEVGIEKHIVSHTGRVTFAMLLHNSEVSSEKISQYLGHGAIIRAKRGANRR